MYASAFERVVLPVVESYAPELVLVSAGFDASARDPLAQMELSANAFGWMARELARRDRAHRRRDEWPSCSRAATTSSRSRQASTSAILGMLTGRAEAITPSDDDGVTRAAQWAKKAWTHVG